MRIGNKFLVVAIAAWLIVASAGCGKKAAAWESYDVNSINVDPYRVNITVNATSSNLTVRAILSQNGSASGGMKVVTNNLTFKSNNENIAVVNAGGQVTGLAAGTTNIIVEYRGGKVPKTAEVPVTVTAPAGT